MIIIIVVVGIVRIVNFAAAADVVVVIGTFSNVGCPSAHLRATSSSN